MELWNKTTGKLWKGYPVDARELLARGGWSKEPVTIEQYKTEEPVIVESNTLGVNTNDMASISDTALPNSDEPRQKRKYTRRLANVPSRVI